ncbi:MAG: hypothetical protein LQ340_003747 [Diploschistes diacapsis]|nr:MAG: hypothetical protein LQ340_003747 [Diploschistes diacapsis]
MLFGAPSSSSDSTPFNETVVQLMQGGANISYVLAFNEPDGSPATGGSSMLASTAAQLWISQVEPLKAKGVRLGGPAVTSAQTGFEWLVNFFAACDGGCSVDFLPIHYYGDFQGLASHIGQVRAAYQNVSLWVTEFGYPNVGLQDAQTFFNQSEQYLDRLDYIERYSYFGSFRSSVSNVGPNEAMLDQNGHLTDIGSWYLGGSATGNVPGAASVTSKLATWSLTVVLFATLAVL